MYNIVRNILISIVVCVFLLLFGIHYALNSEKIVKDAVADFVQSRYQEVKIESLTLKKSKFIYPASLALEDVTCQFELNGNAASLVFDNATIFIKDIFNQERKDIVFSADGLDLDILDVELNNLNLFVNSVMDREKRLTFMAEVDLGSCEAFSYYMSGIKFLLESDEKTFTVKDFVGTLYEGEVSGGIVVQNNPTFDYAAKMRMDRIDFYSLAEVSPEIFSHIRAKVNGDLSVSGDIQAIKSLEVNLEAIDGAMMKATLLKQLLSLVSASLGKDITAMMKTDDNTPVSQALDELIRVDGSVPLTEIKIKSFTEERQKVNTLISFESDKFNLNIDSLEIDTNVEGGYQQLLRFF